MFQNFEHFSGSVLKLNVGYHGWNSQNSKPGRPWSDCLFRSSLIWVCAIWLGFFGRQLNFSIVFQIPFYPFACWVIVHFLNCLLNFFKITFLKEIFQVYNQIVKQFASRSGPIVCRAQSESKLFAIYLFVCLSIYTAWCPHRHYLQGCTFPHTQVAVRKPTSNHI